MEVSKGAFVGSGGQPDLKGVEVLKNLLPDVIDRAMTLVNDDEVEMLYRYARVMPPALTWAAGALPGWFLRPPGLGPRPNDWYPLNSGYAHV